MNILTAEMITKSFSEKMLFKDVSFSITETDKIGIIGINGTGKSSLLKVLAGIEPTDSGRVLYMNGIKLEYLPQEPEFDGENTVLMQVFNGSSKAFETIREYEESLRLNELNPSDTIEQKNLVRLSQKMDNLDAWGMESEAKSILTKLGITEFHKKISELSGGQRKRVAMAASLITPCNLLILDEPTNHIDNETVAWLEKYLAERRGALLMVTHDRYFLDRVATSIFEVRQNGDIRRYMGGYSDYLDARPVESPTPVKEKEKLSREPSVEETKSLKFSFKEQREFETIDDDIAKLEEKLRDISRQEQEFSSDYVRLQSLMEERQKLDAELAEKTDRWVYLNELAEKIQASKS